MLIISLFKIRFLQLFREVRDVGMLRAVILLAVLLPMLALFLYRKLPLQGYNYGIPGIALLFVYMIHRNRKDYLFLAKLSGFPVGIYFMEYLVFSLPLLSLLVVCRQYLQAGLYTALLFPIGMMIPSSKGARTYMAWIRHIPAGMFEWQSGVRMSLPAMVLFYAAGLAGVFSIWLSVAAVALLTITLGSFYSQNEPQKMLVATEQSAGGFLKYKLVQHIRLWALFLSPLFLLAFVHYEYWPYILLAFAAMVNLTGFCILSKYTFYRPATTSGIVQLAGALAWLCTIVLPLAVLVLATNAILYFKAKRNLTRYLYAYH